MGISKAAEIIASWPSESKEAAEIVLEARGEPDEATESQLVWHDAAPWKRVIATKVYFQHAFPAPHIDCVQSVVDYRVPSDRFDDLAAFDGSVIPERTAGEVSARCHDEQANFLALNLMHDIVIGAKSVDEARPYYANEFLDFRLKKRTPYMQRLHFQPSDGDSTDPDMRVLSDQELEAAQREGEAVEKR